MPVETRNCECCNTPFNVRLPEGGKAKRFCSNHCRWKAQKKKERAAIKAAEYDSFISDLAQVIHNQLNKGVN